MIQIEIMSYDMLDEGYYEGYVFNLPMSQDEIDFVVSECNVSSLSGLFIYRYETSLPIIIDSDTNIQYLNDGIISLMEGVETPQDEFQRWDEIEALLNVDVIDINDILYRPIDITDYKFVYVGEGDVSVEVEGYTTLGITHDGIAVLEKELPF